MRLLKNRILPLLIIHTLFLPFIHAQEKIPMWTHFRGSNLDGISTEKELPVKWNDSLNIQWKTAIEGKGWSSPVVYGNYIWFTTATDRGHEMRAICVDFKTGKVIHSRILFRPDTLFRIHAINSYATPTPAIDKDAVYIHFGRYGTACLDNKTGETVWERSDMQVEHIQGPGSSLMLYKEKLIVHMEGSDIQYIAALDKFTGKTIWKTYRPDELYDHLGYIGKKAFITPIIININGRNLLISNGSAACIAYDPETGKEVWRFVQGEDSTVPMAVESEGRLFLYPGFNEDKENRRSAELVALDPDGTGDIGLTNVIWRISTPILQLLTPVVYDGRLYTVNSEGLLSSLEAATGKTVWSKKLKGKYHSSPIYADGYIYVSSTKGVTIVLKAGPEPEIISENKLEGEIWATPAVTGGAILMRTSKFLYKIATPSAAFTQN